MLCVVSSFFFFKQKTAYEMRISDWSSDVCSSDLRSGPVPPPTHLFHSDSQCPTTICFRRACHKPGSVPFRDRKDAADLHPVTLLSGALPGCVVGRFIFRSPRPVNGSFQTKYIPHEMGISAYLSTRFCTNIAPWCSEESRVGKESVRKSRSR